MEDLETLWKNLSPAAQQFVNAVIRIEKEKLHMANPRHVHEGLLRALAEIAESHGGS